MAEIFLCNLELNSGITLEQIKKSKGLFGKLNDEDYNEPINNLFKFWDEIKKTASSLKIKIEPEIIFCSHSSHQRNLSEDYSQFFMHDFMTNHGQSIQNVLCFDLKENIDFGKLQIENKLKSDINKVNQYQIGVMSIFLGDEKKEITKFQQTLAINLRGNGNAKLSFCEFEETKNISFSSILLNSGKLFGKITGDYNQQKSIDEVAPGLSELSNLFVEISESSILKNKLKSNSKNNSEILNENTQISTEIEKNNLTDDEIDWGSVDWVSTAQYGYNYFHKIILKNDNVEWAEDGFMSIICEKLENLGVHPDEWRTKLPPQYWNLLVTNLIDYIINEEVSTDISHEPFRAFILSTLDRLEVELRDNKMDEEAKQIYAIYDKWDKETFKLVS